MMVASKATFLEHTWSSCATGSESCCGFLVFTWQGDSREVVAVKVVAKKTLNKASTENLLTEIEILKSIRHPHIVQLKDFQVSTHCLGDYSS